MIAELIGKYRIQDAVFNDVSRKGFCQCCNNFRQNWYYTQDILQKDRLPKVDMQSIKKEKTQKKHTQ